MGRVRMCCAVTGAWHSSCSLADGGGHPPPAAMEIKESTACPQSMLSRACLRISHDGLHGPKPPFALFVKIRAIPWYDVVIKSAYSIAARFGAGEAASMSRIPVILCLAIVLGGATTARAETPDEWI